ncbi:zeatin O-glucosyltransferase [Ricinus communis]|uniref:Glycosyltransferase n=1 Tax=Ricinus communis TaxID=3988 RepID=B9T1L6_RICCO|nr:zeatin O-glucosyltransferase [Ricinus communis]EEF30255.1 UDP-glucosyltransferase, putative [Ricinus communis]|eukprot:XP_002532135.1 zeatin O-glucosyltransferase [Ricinus communis]
MSNSQHQVAARCLNGENGLKRSQVVVVMVPLPAQGHLNQLLHLSRLILSYNIPVHFVSTTTHNRQAKHRVHGWDPQSDATSNIHFHDFEIPPFPCPPPNPNSKNKFPSHLLPSFFHASSHLQGPVSALLRSLSCGARKVIAIHDSLMASVVQEVALISNAESYTFHSVSAFTICLFYWERMGRPIHQRGGGIPEELPPLDGCFTDEFMDLVASQYQYHRYNTGCLYNTSRLIEGTFMELIEKQEQESTMEANLRKHWALGPFNPVTLAEQKGSNGKHVCLDWLDKQETNSVIYVSFGTTTAMNTEQIKQLAIGLKQSNQKFIWVLRDADKGDVFNGGHERRDELPKGYENSVDGMGLVVRDWVPQLEILGHPATGGFMSHCGWNSCMESITMGVPIAAWPMHSDQPRNAVLITECLKIGVLVKDWARRDEIATSKMVETCVKRLMASDEGDGMRKKAAEMGHSIRRSLGEGGVSRMEMDSFISCIST